MIKVSIVLASYEAFFLGLKMAIFSLYLHIDFSLCVTDLVFVSYKDTNHTGFGPTRMI